MIVSFLVRNNTNNDNDNNSPANNSSASDNEDRDMANRADEFEPPGTEIVQNVTIIISDRISKTHNYRKHFPENSH